MFYLETKDGEKFLTDVNSDDRKEFEKIVEAKMGQQAASLFNDIVEESSSEVVDLVDDFITKLDLAAEELSDLMKSDSVSSDQLETILSDIQGVLSDMRCL